ncbi:extracellular solute-binding protein [Mesorhizobium sp. NZP2298]|uniref:extracellular solute-binding protein n=1 Tax=Mesorhizobium sp. NZP2298 TaxID=2483403 RepID=UPI0015581EBF|nr:extracellular solute-binding protein [Mesorhizobium sp. NZP2298]
MKKLLGNISLVCAIALIASTQSMAQTRELHIMNSGGEYGDALDKCVNGPLLKDANIKVITETPGGYAKIAAQAKSGVITNTVTDGSTGDMYRLAAEGLLEPIDWAKLNPEPMFDEAKNANGFGASYYSTIMAWRKDAKAPQNFVDFFDTEKFPGKRALPDYPEFVLAFAAMGDGMTPEEVQKGVDLDRAFKTLERIKKDTIWWQSGAQPAQLLKDNEVQYAIAWSGRVLGQEGVESTYNQGMLDISWWMVAKGISDEQRDMLYAWMKVQSNAEVQKCILDFLPYPGPSPQLEKIVTPEVLKTFPTSAENKKVQWLINGQWWFDHAAEVEKRWNEFKLAQ